MQPQDSEAINIGKNVALSSAVTAEGFFSESEIGAGCLVIFKRSHTNCAFITKLMIVNYDPLNQNVNSCLFIYL